MARRKDRPGPLEPRSEAILRAIIEEYVATAQPVGSQTLVVKYGLGVSPATVRNVMAELEAAGLLGHPHTSAGRQPTDRGYRLYVESISEAVALAPVEQLMIRHQFGQVEFASEQWFRLAASTLAASTRSAGIATAAKPVACRVRRVDLVAGGGRVANLVLVLAEGPIKQLLVTLDGVQEQDELDAIAQDLNRRLVGRSADGVQAILDELRATGETTGDSATETAGDPAATDPSTPDPATGDAVTDPLVALAVERILRQMREFDASVVEDVFSEGLLNMMEAPEFARSEKLRRVFSVIQDRGYLGGLLPDLARHGGVRVIIGSENPPEEMHDVSLVLAPYGRSGRAVGVVGVLGPTRMAYPHAISTVRYVSGLMNELVDHLYA